MRKTLLSHNNHSCIGVKLVCSRSFCLLECLVMSYELLVLANVQDLYFFKILYKDLHFTLSSPFL